MAKKKASPSEIKKYTSQTLKGGSKGPAVGYLQDQLNSNGAKLTVDEIYGSNTKSAVKSFQKKKKLSADGIVGPNTWSALSNKKTTPAADPKAKKGKDKQREQDKKKDEKKNRRNAPNAEDCMVFVRVICKARGVTPVQGAEVKIGRVRKRTATNGDVSLSVPPGRYKAEVTKRGYKSKTGSPDFEIRASPGGKLKVELEMEQG